MMITMQPDQFTEDYKSSAVIVCDEAFGDANLRLQELPDPVFLRLGGTGTSCLLYTSPSPRDGLLSRMPSSA